MPRLATYVKIVAALALGAAVVAPAQTPVDRVAPVLRRYWTAAPADSIVCVYGRIVVTAALGGDSVAGPVLDSAVVADRCGAPALGGIGFVKNILAPDSVAAAYFVPRLCAILREHPENGLRLVGLIHGIAPEPPRRVLIWACWIDP